MSAGSNVQGIANFKTETAVVNGVRLHYWIGGDPKCAPVLLWHGFLGTAYSWHKVMPLLAEAGFSILVPDMRGYGDSDKPAGLVGYDSRALADRSSDRRQGEDSRYCPWRRKISRGQSSTDGGYGRHLCRGLHDC